MAGSFRFPTAISVVMLVILLAAVATWIIPPGQYNRVSYNGEVLELISDSGKISLPATQHTLDSLGIATRMEKIAGADIRKPIAVPGSYHRVAASPQGIISILEAPFKGIYDSVDIIFFILIIGAFIAIFHESGALEKGVHQLLRRMKGREGMLIIVFSMLFAAGGASYGMAEEALAFFPVLVPVFLAAGYDLLIPVSIIFLAPQIGTLASVSNPFSVIMASDVAGVRWTTGAGARLLLFAVSTGILIWYLLRYGNRVKRNPASSLVSRYDPAAATGQFSLPQQHDQSRLDIRSKLVLLLFAASFAIMITGVIYAGWWLLEMSVVFLAASLLLGFLLRMKESVFVDKFTKGAASLLGVAFIVGLARGVTIILQNGRISDSILYYASGWVQGMPGPLLIITIFLIYIILTLFIASSSGMAVLSMPIMGSLAGLHSLGAQHVVDAYLLGMGVMGMITPTGLALPSLAMVNLNFKTWLRFVLPLMGVYFILSVLYLVITAWSK